MYLRMVSKSMFLFQLRFLKTNYVPLMQRLPLYLVIHFSESMSQVYLMVEIAAVAAICVMEKKVINLLVLDLATMMNTINNY